MKGLMRSVMMLGLLCPGWALAGSAVSLPANSLAADLPTLGWIGKVTVLQSAPVDGSAAGLDPRPCRFFMIDASTTQWFSISQNDPGFAAQAQDLGIAAGGQLPIRIIHYDTNVADECVDGGIWKVTFRVCFAGASQCP